MIPEGVDICIYAGAPLDSLIEIALANRELPAPVAIATPNASPSEFARRVARHLTPPEPVVLSPDGWLDRRRDRIVELPLTVASAQLRRAGLPATLVESQSLIVATDLTCLPPGGAIAIGLWSRFARRRERLAAMLFDARDARRGEHRESLSPEIASLVAPRLLLLRGALSHGPLLIATTDQIAAELAGRALGIAQADPGFEPIGPWEHPLVQRATELDLGVIHPDQLRLVAHRIGGSAAPDRDGLIEVAARVATVLGVRTIDER